MDIALKIKKFSEIDIDFLLNDIEGDESLRTAILISLYTDARHGDQRGWWASEEIGEKWGSRLWTVFEEGKVYKDTKVRLKSYGKECIQWMLDYGVIRSVEVEVELTSGKSKMVYKLLPPNDNEMKEFSFYWDEHNKELLNGMEST